MGYGSVYQPGRGKKKPKPYAGKTKSAPGRKTNKIPRKRK